MAVNVFVYFKAHRADASAVRDALRAIGAALPADIDVSASFGQRRDPDGVDALLDTWLEHYRLPDGGSMPRLLRWLDAQVRDSGLLALLADRRHVEQFDELAWLDRCA